MLGRNLTLARSARDHATRNPKASFERLDYRREEYKECLVLWFSMAVDVTTTAKPRSVVQMRAR
jgi:hypothetical protein